MSRRPPGELWLFDELRLFDLPAKSEACFRGELEHGRPRDETERAELTTWLTRAIGFPARFDEAVALLIELDDGAPVVGVGVLLESGPIMNSSGHPDAAVMLFRQTATMLFRRAATIAYWAELPLPRVDARHMLAIVDPDGAEDWTAQAAASLRSHPIPAPAAGSPGCGSRTHADPPPALLPRP